VLSTGEVCVSATGFAVSVAGCPAGCPCYNTGMMHSQNDILRIRQNPALKQGTLVLAFGGWMDGGEVSTGTVRRLVDLLGAEPFAEIDPEPFYIYNSPGSMEVAALFRPHIEIADGLVKTIEMPSSTFYCHPPADLVLFVGKEPNLRWRTFGECIFRLAGKVGVRRILFVGSFGGMVPHTREPRLYITCSDGKLLREMEPYGVRRTGYQGPGSFTSYLMTQAASAGLEMVSLVAEIPGYLQGVNPMSIEAVTRRLAKLLRLSLDLDSLRAASTAWELQVSGAVEQDEDLARKVHQLEQEYDNDLLDLEGSEA
jgi:proteasome assembly chaperone (PAC2) family protein